MRSIFLFAVCLCVSWPVAFARNPAPTEGLVAYYPFDGDALDATTNHLNGVASNITPVTDRFSNPTGALGFDGNFASVNLGNPAAFNFTDSFTIGCWVKLTNSQINTYIVAKYDPGASTHSYGLGTASSSQPYAFVM